jgi:hypothetical protein
MTDKQAMLWTEEAIEEELLNAYPDTDNAPGPFVIDDMDKAAWASRILKRKADEVARWEAWRQREIERINHVVDQHVLTVESSGEYLKSLLNTYLSDLIQSGEISKKSMLLPGGQIAIRTGRDKIVIEDEEALIHTLHSAGVTDPIKVKESILKTELGKVTHAQGGRLYLNETGEALENVRVEPGMPAFSFKPTEE